jgi:hypothetical protein
MEWYTFGLDRIMMFLFAFFSALVIVIAVMFGKDERGPKKYIEMNWFFFIRMEFYLLVCQSGFLEKGGCLLDWQNEGLLKIDYVLNFSQRENIMGTENPPNH